MGIMLEKALRLPAFRFSAVSGFVYPMEVYSWANKLIKTSDRKKAPVAWQPNQAASYYGQTEAAFLAASNRTRVIPDALWGEPGRRLVVPRAVLLNEPLFFYSSLSDLFTPLHDALAAKNVWVGRGVDYDGWTDGALSMTLPHAAEEDTSDTTQNGTFVNTVPIPSPEEWVAGEIMYVDYCEMLGQINGPWADSNFDWTQVDVHVNHRQRWIDVVQDAYPRYERFRHHVCFNVDNVSTPSPEWTAGKPAFIAAVTDACDALAAYGVTCTVIENITSVDQIKDDIRNAVTAFFDL